MRSYTISIFLFLVWGSVIVLGQGNWVSLKFNHLTTKNGLSNSEVNCIVQDRFGYIWFGTNDGLNRYDGYKFRVYKHTSDKPGVLIDNIITALKIDTKGRLWVGTIRGVSIYNEKKDDFTNFVLDSVGIADNQINRVNSIIDDSAGSAIAATEGGFLYQFNDQKQLMIKMQTPNFGTIKNMVIDGCNNIYIASTYGLFRYNFKTGISNHFTKDDLINPIPTNRLTFLCINKKKLWIGTEDKGIFIINTQTLKNEVIETSNPGHIHIQCIEKDLNGNIWVGDFAGLRLFPKGEIKSIDYYHSDGDILSLGGSGISYIYSDRQSNLWIGIGHIGVDYILNSKKFDHYRKETLSPIGLSSEIISSVLSDSKGRLWIGLYNGGINIIDSNKNGIIRITSEDRYKLDMSSVQSIYEDKKGVIWLGTYLGGLYYWNELKSSFQNYRSNYLNSNSLPCNDIRSITEDNAGNLWLVTHGYGITKFDRKTEAFFNYRRNFNNPNNTILDDWSFNILSSSNGLLWIGGPSGITVLDPKTMTCQIFQFSPRNPKSLTKGFVNYIYEDSKKQIWVATDYGFCRYNKSDNSFINYSESAGVLNHKFCGILEDSDKNLWISSNIGLLKYNSKTNRLQIFDENDGLQSNEFSPGTCSKSAKGELFFGGSNGLSGFFPRKITDYQYIPTILITDLQLFNESVIDPIISTPKHEKIRKDFLSKKQIQLSYNQNIITLEFVALNYLNPKKNRYSYKLEGFEENWNTIMNKRDVTYTNLNPGTYTFKVKACNSDGYWNNEGDNLVITIIPPFWKQIWFRLLFVLSICSMVYLFFIIRERHNKAIKIYLEQTVIERTQELQNAHEEIMEQHDELVLHRNHLEEIVQNRTKELETAKFKAVESDRLKSSFLANMSHEIRTPMNAITGFIFLLGDRDIDNSLKSKYINIITRNSEVLLRLIDDILDFSKIEAGELKVSSDPLSLADLLEDINTSYISILKNRNASSMRDVEFKYKNALNAKYLLQNPEIVIASDKLRLNQILTNLIENAIKFTERGYIEIGIENQLIVDDSGEYIELYIEDSGIGISAEELPFIFDRFRKVESDISKIYRGVGLGLAISKRLACLLGGTLEVKSKLAIGSRFSLLVPYKVEVFPVTENLGLGYANKAIREVELQKNKIILIAEDDESNYKLLETILSKVGYKILWAKDGVEAVSMASELTVHLVLMDIKLPLLNGILAMKKIKEVKPHLPVIAQTAYAMSNEQSDMLQAGFEGYISKPISYDVLKEIIQKFIL